jgi:DNA-binding MarR family transcriptional regulator
MRTTSRFGDRRRETKHCKVCGLPTREGKPFCPDHVEQHPYVTQLLRKLQRKEEELEGIDAIGHAAIHEDSIVAQDILVKLRAEGPRTIERLARELGLDPKIVEGYGRYLSQKGLITTHVSGRGSRVFKIASLRRHRFRRNPYWRSCRKRNPYWIRKRRNPWSRPLSRWTAHFAMEREEGEPPYQPLDLPEQRPSSDAPSRPRTRRPRPPRTGPTHYQLKREQRFKGRGLRPEHDIKYANCIFRDTVEYGEDKCALCDANLSDRYLLHFRRPEPEDQLYRFQAKSFFPVGNECVSNWTEDLPDSEDKRVYLEIVEAQIGRARRLRRQRAQQEAVIEEEIVEEPEIVPDSKLARLFELLDDASTDDDW